MLSVDKKWPPPCSSSFWGRVWPRTFWTCSFSWSWDEPVRPERTCPRQGGAALFSILMGPSKMEMRLPPP